MTNPLRTKTGRVDGELLLFAVDYIAEHHASTLNGLAEVLGVSEPTMQRLFRSAREQVGVKITYQRTN